MAKRRCFISARYGLDLTALQRALEDNGVEWQWANELISHSPIMDSISSAIDDADFIVGVSVDEPLNTNVALEIGYAIGRDVPVMLLASGGFTMPFDIAKFSCFKTDLKDQKLLSFQIDLFLRSLQTAKPTRRPTTNEILQTKSKSVAKPSAQEFASALERTVVDSILEVGGRVTYLPNLREGKEAADLLMWLPNLDRDLFNPAAVEVKKSVGINELPRIQNRLDQFVRSSGLGCGLLVVSSVSLARNLSRVAPFQTVFIISVPDFTDKLRKRELGTWIRTERNRLAHGVR